ncbi:MAG: tetratricopeptide repeat [Prolixibacteraceae bacterium]|nr:MAG: tetratricopeptide repeat [Prolixibacteraceae bacterium]
MKAFMQIIFLKALIVLAGVYGTTAQKIFKGTVYMEGEPAAGIIVEAHRGTSMMTSFDGKYEVTGDSKSKFIKFTLMATNESKRFDLNENSTGEIDFAFTGVLPGAGGNEEEVASGDLVLKTDEELLAAQDKDFMTQYSLYTEFYKQGDFASALPYWKHIYNKYPKSTSNIYIHGAKIFEYLIENAKTDAEKDKYLDEFIKVYDQRIKYFNGEGFVNGRKGTTWLKYKLDENRTTQLEGDALKEVMLKGYEWLNLSVDAEKAETELPVFLLLMQTTRSLFKLNALPKETVVKNYDKCNTYLNAIIAKNTDKQKTDDAKEIQTYIESLFTTSGAADCEALVNIFSPQFEARNSDIDFIKSMLRRLRQAKCDDSQLVEKATIRLYELEPSAEAAFNMARGYVEKDDLENAKKFYQQAISQETDKILLASYYYERGLVLYVKEGNYQEAREMARMAISLDPELCDAYMLIGNIYASASSSFSGTNLEKSAVFWVVVDYFNKARKYDDCAAEAANKASDYRKYFPNKEDGFMEGLREGQSYKVEGWINETTTVRF